MIHFDPVPEPPDFDEKARKPGVNWLKKNPNADRPRDYWSRFKQPLRTGFYGLCGYSAMYVPWGSGEVDHYVGYKEAPSQAYEWSNYRYSSGWMNKAKAHRRPHEPRVLDPYEVEDDWFELHLPSLQLKIAPGLPDELRQRAEYTLKRLHLRDDERTIQQRWEWYKLYLDGNLTLEGLRETAPLIARAVEKQQTDHG